MKIYNVLVVDSSVCSEDGYVNDYIDSDNKKEDLIDSYGCNLKLLEEGFKEKMLLLIEEGIIDIDLDVLDEISVEDIKGGDWEEKLEDLDDWWYVKLVEKEFV